MIELNFKNWQFEIDKIANDPVRIGEYEKAVRELEDARVEFERVKSEKEGGCN